MDNHYTLSAEQYEASREGHLQGRRREMVVTAIDRYLGSGGRVMEIGCGPGGLLASLAADRAGVEFAGIDIEPKMIEHARGRHRLPNLSFEERDLVGRPLEPSFDLVYSVDVLHHVAPLGPFVGAVRQTLVPGGCWLAIEPNVYNPYIWWSQERMRRASLDEDHFRPWVAEPAFAEAGLEVVRRRYGFLVPGSVRRVPEWLTRLERWSENLRFLGGSVVYELRVPSSSS